MRRLSAKLRAVQGGILHFCPACNEPHMIGLGWRFDGNVDAPTFEPSVRLSTKRDDHGERLSGGQSRTLCHYHLRGGVIEYCSDSPHALAGQRVPLPDHPTSWG